MDKIRLPADLGKALALYREDNNLSATGIAAKARRSRTMLYKLEHGQDVTVTSLFDILRAMCLCLSLQKAGMPTLEEMQRRFVDDGDDADVA